MALLIANNPPASRTKVSALAITVDDLIDRARTSVHACQRTIGAKSSALVTLENVAIPRSTAATTSLRPLKSHCILRGAASGRATSLYSQQKYARNTSEKLHTSGISHTKYTGTTDAITKPDASTAETSGPERAGRKRYPHRMRTDRSSACSTRKPFVPNIFTKGAAHSG